VLAERLGRMQAVLTQKTRDLAPARWAPKRERSAAALGL